MACCQPSCVPTAGRLCRTVPGKCPACFAQIVHEQLRPTEFAAELQLMAAKGIGQVVRQVPRGVRAAEVRSFSHSAPAEAGNFHIGRAEIKRCDSGIEAQRNRIGAVIQVVKFLKEIVVSKKHLVDHAWTDRARPYRGPILLPAGNGLEVFFINRARERGGISGPDNGTNEEPILFAFVVINSAYKVVAQIHVIVAAHEVVWSGGGVSDSIGPEIGQEVRHYRIDGNNIILAYNSFGFCDPSVRGNSRPVRLARNQTLPFVIQKEESLVFHQRPANRTAEIVVAELARSSRRVKRLLRRHRIIAVEIVSGAVNLVRPRFDHHVDHGARIAPIVGPAHALLVELRNGVNGQEHAGDGGNAPLVDRLRVVPKVVVVHAVELPVVLV